jgi:transcriptional regulator of arginine metabolism
MRRASTNVGSLSNRQPATRFNLPATFIRREAIRKIIRGSRVGNQEELRRLLEKEGFEVTQATLSRDLAQLAARRVALPEGGTAYEFADAMVENDSSRLLDLSALVISIEENGSLVVLQTEPGAASAIALGIDRARLPEALGTIAGDDTIFLAPAKGVSARRAADRLIELFGKGAAA